MGYRAEQILPLCPEETRGAAVTRQRASLAPAPAPARVLPREHGEGHWDLAGSVVERVFSGGFQEDRVPAWSPEGGVEGDDLDYLWQKLTSDQRPNCCLL